MSPKTQQYSIVDPVKPELEENIIKNGKVNSELRDKILNQVRVIEKTFKQKIEKVYIIGSSITYQYTSDCDIDVTLLIKVDKEILKDLNKELSEKFNEKMFLQKHPINFHFNSGNLYKFNSDAIYDLINNKWVKKPEALCEDDLEEIIQGCQNLKEFTEILKEYSVLKDLLENYNGDLESLDEIFQQTFKVNYLFEKIRDQRREDYKKRKDENIPSANFRCSNVIFKLLEQYGLDDLSSQITKIIKSRAKF